MTSPVLASYHRRFSSSVAIPSWTTRLPDRSSGSISPRFSRHSRISACSSLPIMIRASEPPMKYRLVPESAKVFAPFFINDSRADPVTKSA
jgi:hypothetical protein